MDTKQEEKQDEFKKDYKLVARIAKVSFIDEEKSSFDNSEKRVFLTLNESFISFDKDGNKVTTNRLTIDAFNLSEMIVTCNPDCTFSAILSQTFGKSMKPNLFASCLQGGQVSIKREYHAKDSLRKDGKSTYSHDTFTSTIISFDENINKIAQAVINKAIENEDFIVKEDDEEKAKKAAVTLSQKWQW